MVTKAKDKSIKDITIADLKKIVADAIEEKFQEYLGDPDEGLELREEIIEKLKAQKVVRKKRIPMAQVAKEFGLNLK